MFGGHKEEKVAIQQSKFVNNKLNELSLAAQIEKEQPQQG